MATQAFMAKYQLTGLVLPENLGGLHLLRVVADEGSDLSWFYCLGLANHRGGLQHEDITPPVQPN